MSEHDYGVPTGYVPRVEPIKRPGVQFVAELPPSFDEKTHMALHPGGVVVTHPDHPPVVIAPPDRIQQAVDRWIDMERKAKAWDAALKEADEAGAVGIKRYDLDLIWQSA